MQCIEIWIWSDFRYKGMVSHSFDRFYVVTKIEIPKIEDLKLTMFQFEDKCSYVDVQKGDEKDSNGYYQDMKSYCEKIVPYVFLYKKQIEYYNRTALQIIGRQNKFEMTDL